MQLRTRTWFLISLLCLVGAGVFWHLGNKYEERRRQNEPAVTNALLKPEIVKELGPLNYSHSSAFTNQEPRITNTATNSLSRSNLLSYRLTNTSKTIGELTRLDSAVLLRNALIDTAAGVPVVPEQLRSQADPGAYVVQANTAPDDAFRSRLKAAGGEIVSYIPNNAYLVRMNEEGAQQMRGYRGTAAVLPWEPYYKLALRLLPWALDGQPLPPGVRLNVLLFPGERDQGLKAIEALGAKIELEQRSPFGPQVTITPSSDSLLSLAGLNSVQGIELHGRRVVANDLGRPRIGVARNSVTNGNYLGLTGKDVQIALVDTGVDPTHPDLRTNRVFGLLGDADGHGTHVAGTIIGNGSQSGTVSTNPPPPGSTNTGANFRGVAPEGKLFALPIDTITGPLYSETYLQETAALNTNYIVNNSWGYPDLFDYDLSAASYDAAVRDALTGKPGSQPLIMVFAAGNSGEGSDDGQGGNPGTITSPGTAKNVITVAASESLRRITNEVIFRAGITNAGTTNPPVIGRPFLGPTDADDQVAAFSSRGNVGVGLEGTSGRFKPDVAAPGTFIISCRSSNWQDPTAAVGTIVNRITDEAVGPGETNFYNVFVQNNAIQLGIRILTNSISRNRGLPDILIYAGTNTPPVVDNTTLRGTNQAFFPVTPGFWWFGLRNTNNQTAFFDIQTIVFFTNAVGNYFEVLSNLNAKLAPFYRYESGSSMAAGFVSGTLGLMQEMFENPSHNLRMTNSPALMKALLINGARPMSCAQCPDSYDFNPQTVPNYEGWGLVNLSNTLPLRMSQTTDSNLWPTVFFDEEPTNGLATGESHLRNIKLTPRAQGYPLRVTLVWTDPPGNPAASVKLVNDLDLIVTNKLTGEYYIGNNFPEGFTVTPSTFTNDIPQPAFDVINNVENVYIREPIANEYDIVVRARRVNVNAVTAQTNGVLQDYALVISVGNSAMTNQAFASVQKTPTKGSEMTWTLKYLTNQQALVNERVGANNPLRDPAPNEGFTNQWNYYIFSKAANGGTNWGSNVAIVTFLAPNASLSRAKEADVDLYVSAYSSLTNLDAAVLADAAVNRNNSWSSRTRLGSESVILPGIGRTIDTFYIAVKSEDQQAADFGIFAIATDESFGGSDQDGNTPLRFFPIGGLDIPDGSAEQPGGTNLFAFVANSITARRVILTNSVTHENAGDLIGIVSHNAQYAFLNNHREFPTLTEVSIYDDSEEADIAFSRRTDGPGSLNDFQGTSGQGVWTYTIADNSPLQVGRVNYLVGLIEPQDDLTNSAGLFVSNLGPSKWKYFALDVPLGVTNMIISVYNIQPPNPLDLYLRRGARPTPGAYDKYTPIPPTGGAMSCSIYDDPPLLSGRYIIGVSNPSPAAVSFRIRVDYQYSLTPIDTATYISSPSLALVDDSITNTSIFVTNQGAVADVRVGLRLDHPRLSDLVVHLVSPQGTRILLAENRGGLYVPATLLAVTNLGLGSPTNYVVPFGSSGNEAEFSTNFTGLPGGPVILQLDYQFFTVPDEVRVYCGTNRSRLLFNSGYISGGGTFTVPLEGCTDIEVVVNEGTSPLVGTVWQLTVTVTGPWNYATFTDNPHLGGMYKFEPPPYFTVQTNYLVVSNSFEGSGDILGVTNIVNYGVTVPPTIFEDWSVRTNGVAVVTDTNGFPFHGTNYLVLSHGEVSLPLTNLVVDREYILSFAYRKVSSAVTQQVERAHTITGAFGDAVGGNADIRYFFKAPAQRVNETPPVPVPKLRVCPGQAVFITATNFIGEPPGPAATPRYGPEGITNALGQTNIIGPLYSLIGCWSSHPTRLDGDTIASGAFYIGTNKVVTAPTAPGDYYLFLGVNRDDFRIRFTGGFDVTMRWQQCQYSSAEYVLGSTARPLLGNFFWQREKIRFVANPSITNLLLRTNINTTMLFDDFRIEEPVSTIYYQSEEPMTPLHGELAAGNWRLELWDNRAGPMPTANSTNTGGVLYSWALTFIFGDTIPPIGLTNGVDYIGTVRGEEIKYFRVAVPREVQAAANTVFSIGGGNGVELLYSPLGLPTGNSPPDPLLPIPEFVAPPTLQISRSSPINAEMPVGRDYFLGVRNINPGETNRFVINAQFDIPVSPLVNGRNSAANIIPRNPNPFAAQKDSSEMSVTNMHYYYFDVTTNDLSAKFEVITNHIPGLPGSKRNINIVLKRALPVVDLFPTPFSFDYQATEASPQIHDLIIVNSNSIPVKLAPGRWYLGVYNFDTTNIQYRVRATATNVNMFTHTELTNGVPTNFNVQAFGQLTNFYRFVADQTNAAILFEIYDLDEDADLIMKRGDLPSRDLYDFSFLMLGSTNTYARRTTPGDGYEPIPLRTNLYLPHLNATNWWLGIYTRGSDDANGMICVKTFTNVNPLVGCVFNASVTLITTNGSNFFQLDWQSVAGTQYQPEVTTDLIVWTPLGPPKTGTGGMDSYIDMTVPPSGLRFYRVRTVP